MLNRRMLIAGGLASMVLPGMVKARAAAAAPKFRAKLVTKTFANHAKIVINADPNLGPNPYPSSINVHGFPRGRTRHVRVTLHGFSHQSPEEVFLLLVAPGGRRTLLLGQVGAGSLVEGLVISLDQKAPFPLPQFVPPAWTSGAYKPTNYGGPRTFAPPAPIAPIDSANLAVFNGGNPNGRWRLFVQDAATGAHYGEITSGWSLRITARVKIPIRPNRPRR